MNARRERLRAAPLCLLFVAMLSGCATAASGWRARPLKSADALFHRDPRWRGADAAYSVPLDGGRVLWLFGDTFIGDGKVRRADAAFIRNSIAIQTGLDVRNAAITFHWGGTAARPRSYFPATAGAWLWPVHGIFRNGALTLFFMRAISAEGGLGFALKGGAALRTGEISGAAETWRFKSLALPPAPEGLHLLYGVAVIEEGGYVLAYCTAAPGDHDAYLARWRSADFDAGDLARIEWWDGDRYVRGPELEGAPAVVLPGAATEFSVSRLADGRYVQVQSLGFPDSEIAYRLAARPEGPWSGPRGVYRPLESDRRGVLVYAAKAHPELSDEGLLVTYAANHFEPETLLRDESLYFPRFVRIQPGE